MKKTRYAVVDLETTGTGSVEESRIIQIGCAFIEGDQITETYQTKINPQMTIPKRISRLTGINKFARPLSLQMWRIKSIKN